jgi:hypothetical protein
VYFREYDDEPFGSLTAGIFMKWLAEAWLSVKESLCCGVTYGEVFETL